MLTYAAQLGYLFCKPEGSEDFRYELIGMDLPILCETETLHKRWQEAGLAAIGPAGAIPISWQELRAFADLTACDIKPFEAVVLMEMSRAYCAETSQRSPLRLSPMERHD